MEVRLHEETPTAETAISFRAVAPMMEYFSAGLAFKNIVLVWVSTQ